jgi:hypothetical protein
MQIFTLSFVIGNVLWITLRLHVAAPAVFLQNYISVVKFDVWAGLGSFFM